MNKPNSLILLSLAVASLGLSGCMVVPQRGMSHGALSQAPQCRPSQHWDGHECRHNGNGWGARKHDGE